MCAYNYRMVQRTNDEWVSDLRAGDERQSLALEDLRAIILRGLPYALSGKLPSTSPVLLALTEEVAQETLLRVLAHLNTFEGRSKFTTWVQKIAVRQALGELRHRRWGEVPLPEMQSEGETTPRDIPDTQPDPETIALRNDMIQRVNRIINEELTAKQRQVVNFIAIQGLPIETTARQMNMKPNAIYKLLHDARVRLKRRLEDEGLTPAQVLSFFERNMG